MSTTEPLSVREIRRRLREVDRDSCHLARTLPKDNPHNRILTLADIGRHVTEQPRWLRLKSLETPPGECDSACPSVNECRRQPPCRKIEPYLQRRLSDFFNGWDHGELVKACVAGVWKITPRHTALAPLVAAPGQKTHEMGVTMTTGSPRLTWR